ncbi:outer membrane receptor protein involved in Fe transport [Novosphingobium sp. SG751A]|uniref:TonB-dependent receptor n=1 Tax=Novosphingobium sp. SG751A TaxID=2587000 RepID=UPI0015555599|nr:TonB-dependent receptor [Novosphingobium sp. SG751A]NOW47376.1 outer membrane receptor protein involved in Fe transport [Novosphingobium sp. SG751A]
MRPATFSRLTALLCTSASLLALAPMTALAQSAEAASAPGEIVVSAQRRNESLSKVPISIAAFTGKDLEKTGITDVSELSKATPGFHVSPGATIGGGNNISIRGVSTTQGAATVGIYIDDVPTQSRANNWTQPVSPSLFDLERVEVLRGPQGTLYGASSEGGTVRFITTAPSLTTWSGKAVGEISANANGGIGYETGVAMGGPLIADKLGIRVSVDNRRDGGFIDQMSRTVAGKVLNSNINSTDNTSVRVALTYAPTDKLTITPFFNYQRLHGNDNGLIWSGIWPTSGKYQSFEQTSTPYTDEIKIGSLKMAYNFGGATLTSITSGNWRDLSRVDDYTQVAAYNIFGAGGTRAFMANNPNFGSPQSTATKQTLFTQEIRLTTNDQTAPVYGTVGVFLSTSKQSLLQVEWGDANASYPSAVYFLQGGNLVPSNAFNYTVNSGPYSAGGILASKYQVEIDRQASAFADATWNVTSKLKFNAGVRVARQSYSFQYIGNGYFQGGVQILPLTSTKSTPINPKFNISWQTNPNLLLYATAAKGNRAGGANRPIPAARCAADIAQNGSIPQTYGDDSVWSFEGGMKGRFLGGKLSVSGSGFYLKWHNVQQNLSLSNCSFSYVGNFGDATSKGFDLSISARPTTWATISGNVGYTKATLDQNVTGTANATTGVAPVLATKGSALSFVPDWTADVALDLNHALPWYGLNGSLRVDYQYAGQYTRTPALGSTLYNAINFQGDAYELVNLRAGVARDAWTFSVFAKNLTNAYPTLYKSSQSGAANIFLMTSTLAPRTIGANFTYRW